jgi:S1-C subfamily serine protease
MLRNKWLWIVVIALVVGGIGGVMFNRFVIPWLASMPGLSGLHKLESSNPVIINRREEVQLNEGANYSDLSKQAAAYTVGIYSQTQGSYKFLENGIIASSDGLILASKIAINGQTNLVAMTNDGSNYPALVRALDPKSELAVLTISGNNLPFAQFADAWDLEPSQRLIFIGRSNKEFVHEFALGSVTQSVANQSSLERVSSSESFENYILSDAKISPDFVGGPVINLNGRVVGMANSGLGIQISESLSTAVTSFFQNGKIVRPTLGLKFLNLSASLAKLRGQSQAGLFVVSVDDASPAKLAGILPGDLVLTVDNQAVPQGNFEKILNQHSLGDMPVTVLRNNSQINLTVKLK